LIIKALVKSFNDENVFIRCSCPDFKYRFSYQFTKKGLITGPGESIPADITNPNDDLGNGCKHILLVLGNTNWVISLGSVIYNYINYMELHYKKMYADIIYPAIYGKKYEEPVQLDLDTIDKDELDTDSETVDKSNRYARDKGKFKKGNTQGVRFARKPDNSNKSLFDLADEEDEE
jgi:hypothetical protein